jgi:hypothetical protein
VHNKALANALIAGLAVFGFGSVIVGLADSPSSKTETVVMVSVSPSPYPSATPSPVYVKTSDKVFIPYVTVSPSPVYVYQTVTVSPPATGSGDSEACREAVRAARQALNAVGTDDYDALLLNFEIYEEMCR